MSDNERQMLVMEKGRSLSDVAFEKMRTLILNGTWPANSRLPSEAQLCRTFGVSRPVVRQALARLRDADLVQSRQGSGSFVLGDGSGVQQAPHVHFPPIGSVADLETFLAFRQGLEGEAAASAAVRRTDSQLAQLKHIAERLSDNRTVDRLSGEDFAFHLAVADATGNPFYANTLNSLREQFLLGMGMAWTFSIGNAVIAQEVVRQHDDIVDAIERRQEDGARSAMRRHLQWTKERLLKGSGLGS